MQPGQLLFQFLHPDTHLGFVLLIACRIQFNASDDNYLFALIEEQLIDLSEKLIVIGRESGRIGGRSDGIPHFNSNPAHQFFATGLKHFLGLSIMGMAPVILNFDKKQSFVVVNSQKVHCFGGMQRFAYFFMRQMLIILDHIPLGSLEIEVYAAFLNIIHID